MRSFCAESDYRAGRPMAIRFESKKDGTGAAPEKPAKVRARVEESLDEEVEAANAPEMPFAKPAPRPKKARR